MADRPVTIFGLGNLPGGSKEGRIDELRRERYDTARAEAYNMSQQRGGYNPYGGLYARADAGLAGTVANLTSLFENTKFGQEKLGLRPGGMTEHESRMYDIQEQARADFDAQKAEMGAKWDNLSATQKQVRLMDSMARSAYKMGDMDTYATLVGQISQITQADELNRAKIADLDGTNVDPNKANFDRMRQWWPGSQRQQMRDTFGAVQNSVSLLGDIVNLVDQVTTEQVDPVTGDVTRRAQEADVLTKHPGGVISFLSGLRNLVHTAATEIKGVYADSDERNDFRAAVDSAKRGLGSERMYDSEGNVRNPDATSAVEGDPTTNGEVDQILNSFIPESITGANERARYKSIIVQMAYAQWRQNEGSGSRQASNQDIAMALDQLGANGTSMDMVLQTMMQNTLGGVRKLEQTINQNIMSGKEIGLDDQFIERSLFGGSVSDLYGQLDDLIGRTQKYTSPTRAEYPEYGGPGTAAQEPAAPVSRDDLINSWLPANYDPEEFPPAP